MKTLKKIVAGTSAIALLAMNAVNFTANAAAINNATAVVTPGTWIVVTWLGFGVNGTDTCSATITKTNNNGTSTVVTVDSCTITDDTTMTIAAATVAASEYYTIAFTSSTWVFGTTTKWDTTNNVVVSARVLPILTMSVSNAAVNLGVLSPTAITESTTDTTVAVATNANWGYVVSAAATNFHGATTLNDIPFVTRAAQSAGTEGFSIDIASINQATNGTSTAVATAWVAWASTYAVATSAASLGSWNGTADGDQFIVNYAAAISPVTEADNYSTTVTYTVSGTF